MFRRLPDRMHKHQETRQEKREEQLLRQGRLLQGTMKERVLQPERPHRTGKRLPPAGRRQEEAQRAVLPAEEGLVTGLVMYRKAWKMRTIHLSNYYNE